MKIPVFKIFSSENETSLETKSPLAYQKKPPISNADKKSAAQMELVSKILGRLAEKGITKKDTLKIKFVFMGQGNTEFYAFQEKLKAQCRCANADKKQFGNNFLISGYTYPLAMEIALLQNWVKTMGKIAEAHQLEFLGWGVAV